jgi:hypothetical protein
LNAKLASRPLLLALAGAVALILAVGVVLALDSGDDSVPPVVAEASATLALGTSPSSVPSAIPTAGPATSIASPVPATQVAPPGVWMIELLRTGGIAGLAQEARIESSGQATFKDQRAQRTVTRTLNASQQSALATLIDGSGFFAQAATQVSPCADCFQLKITLTMNARTQIVVANDLGLSPSLKPLAERLTMLLQEGLQ